MPETTKRREPPKKYHEPVQGTIYHGDGREQALKKSLLEQFPSASTPHDSDKVLKAIDDFGKEHYLMNVGDTKGEGVEAIIKERKPKLVLEIGTYVGYSAITFSRHLPKLHPSSTYPGKWTSNTSEDRAGYISLEMSPVYADTARTGLDLVGLGDVVRIVEGPSSSSLKTLRETLNMPRPLKFDLIFIDHLKPLYTNDIKILEDEGLIGEGTCVVADNVVKPGNPAYLSYVRASPSAKRSALAQPPLSTQPAITPNPKTEEAWEKSFKDGPLEETRWTPDEAGGQKGKGNPNLVYGSEMVWGYDPTTAELDACEVSVCLREEKE